jgi:hypothetical protein
MVLQALSKLSDRCKGPSGLMSDIQKRLEKISCGYLGTLVEALFALLIV